MTVLPLGMSGGKKAEYWLGLITPDQHGQIPAKCPLNQPKASVVCMLNGWKYYQPDALLSHNKSL